MRKATPACPHQVLKTIVFPIKDKKISRAKFCSYFFKKPNGILVSFVFCQIWESAFEIFYFLTFIADDYMTFFSFRQIELFILRVNGHFPARNRLLLGSHFTFSTICKVTTILYHMAKQRRRTNFKFLVKSVHNSNSVLHNFSAFYPENLLKKVTKKLFTTPKHFGLWTDFGSNNYPRCALFSIS